MSAARLAVAAAAGFVFALGLGLSGMTRPEVVQGFLDPFGDWDPSLAIVMGVGVPVYHFFYRLTLRRPQALLAPVHLPGAGVPVDARLVGGAALFGVGWGMAGLCPAPALVDMLWNVEVLAFVAAMLAGIVAVEAFGPPAPRTAELQSD